MLKAKQYIKSVEELAISVEDVSRYMSSNGSDVPDYFVDATRIELDKIRDQKVKFGYEIYQAELLPKIIKLENTKFNVGDEISEALEYTEFIAVFACTVSEELEQSLTKYSYQDEMTEAYIVDIVGTLIVEKSTGILSDYLKNESKEYSLRITNTQSPGNCGWDVEEQNKLFGLLPENYLGIKLNESGMMYPVKSISGIVGIGKKVKFKHSECNLCTSANCMYRKEPFNGELKN